jgi:hypothetical protein
MDSRHAGNRRSRRPKTCRGRKSRSVRSLGVARASGEARKRNGSLTITDFETQRHREDREGGTKLPGLCDSVFQTSPEPGPLPKPAEMVTSNRGCFGETAFSGVSVFSMAWVHGVPEIVPQPGPARDHSVATGKQSGCNTCSGFRPERAALSQPGEECLLALITPAEAVSHGFNLDSSPPP